MTLEQGSSTFRVRGPIYIVHIILQAAVIADYKIIMDSFILQLLHRFTYVTAHSPTIPPTSQLILKPFRRFTYVTAHSPTLPPLYLRHSSFYNPSVASPTSQLILQPFRRFIYAIGHSTTLSLLHLCHRQFA